MTGIDLDGHRSVVLDLAGVTFCDAGGVTALIRAHHHLREVGGYLSIRGVSGFPLRVFTITGVDKALDVE